MNKPIVKRAVINSLATAVYIAVVGLFMSNASAIFGEEDNALTSVVALMLLVLSAAVTATLMFGQPAMWYVDGKKKQALQLLGATIISFAGFTLLAMIGLAVLY